MATMYLVHRRKHWLDFKQIFVFAAAQPESRVFLFDLDGFVSVLQLRVETRLTNARLPRVVGAIAVATFRRAAPNTAETEIVL
jgi:hypothetical protein